MSKNHSIVIGDGWAALGSVLGLAQSDSVSWLSGTGGRMVPPFSVLEAGEGASAWLKLLRGTGALPDEVGSTPEIGQFLREFRNKSFREPAWTKAPTPEARREVACELLWAPEVAQVPIFEAWLGLPLDELEELVRSAALALPGVSRLEGVPIQGFRVEDEKVQAVILGSGEELPCQRVIYADRWSALPGLSGVPKGLSFLRKRDPVGVLQAVFTHSVPVASGSKECFFGALHKEAGEDIQRHVWGYFSHGGLRSTWTIVLGPEEVEDNHAIAKKLRRMKQALDKMFVGAEWGIEKDFLSTVVSEQVRFEESLLFSSGERPKEPLPQPQWENAHFLTDGYGPACSLLQVARLLGWEHEGGELPVAPPPLSDQPESAS